MVIFVLECVFYCVKILVKKYICILGFFYIDCFIIKGVDMLDFFICLNGGRRGIWLGIFCVVVFLNSFKWIFILFVW